MATIMQHEQSSNAGPLLGGGTDFESDVMGSHHMGTGNSLVGRACRGGCRVGSDIKCLMFSYVGVNRLLVL